MKTIAKTLAILTVLLACGTSMMGQPTALTEIENTMTAYSPGDRVSIESNRDRIETHRVERTDRIRLENWMSDDNEWRIRSRESEIALELWMLDPRHAGELSFEEIIRVDPEAPLKLQKWMYCCDDWRVKF